MVRSFIQTVNFILIFVCLKTFPQTHNASTINLLSLKGKEITFSIDEDIVNDRITLTLNLNEIICVNGCRGVEELKVLNDKFLLLVIRIRGGSGIKLRRSVLICISQDKFYKTLDILSLIQSEFNKTYVSRIDSQNLYDEHSIYKAVIFKIAENKNSYDMYLEQYEKVSSKVDPKQNHEIKDTIKLMFNNNEKYFFTGEDTLNGRYTIDDAGNTPHYEKYFNNELFPVIKLLNDEYYFINREWYLKDGKNHLTKLSHSSN